MGLTKSVTPNLVAISFLSSFTSTPTIILAPAIFAAYTTDNPTAPNPKTTTDLPYPTLQVFQTAPQPVDTPHPKRQTLFKSADLLILAQEISANTVY